MELVDLGPEPPSSLLAWEEAFLDDADQNGVERIWFWESTQPFVVVGYGQTIGREVNVSACEQHHVPILRRCSGGGTVLQGPGCLSYGLALRQDRHAELESVTGANRWIMNRQAAALNRLTGLRALVRGHTDLAVEVDGGPVRKVSGNAQRRSKNALLFHGTFLCHAHLELISQFLPLPPLQPEYRSGRTHAEFLANLGHSPEAVRQTLCQTWEPTPSQSPLPSQRYRELLTNRYLQPLWHRSRGATPAPNTGLDVTEPL